MAAEVLSAAGVSVQLFDAMASSGRKFLLAGKGGLNLTHSEPPERFVSRYFEHSEQIGKLLLGFDAQALRAWAKGLGIETFVGTSGRVFPKDMKAAPLLRAWLQRLRHPVQGGPAVQFHMRHRWLGWTEDGHHLRFDSAQAEVQVQSDALVLALGGGSWSRLGSNGAWVPLLAERGVDVAPLLPSNCGFDVSAWSEHFRTRFAGQPFKSVAISFTNSLGQQFSRKGEFVATASGIEGSLIYAASSLLRDEIARSGQATLQLDLLPDHSPQQVLTEVAHPRGSRSLSSHLKGRLGLEGIKMAILHELLDKQTLNQPALLAQAIKSLPISLVAARPLDEAISSAGGVRFEALTDDLMCKALPGVFCAGEMLDWEAPTGGYLLTASIASGRKAGLGAVKLLKHQE
jgi:uncharacterized flavoprotein (TIGR03862 family)